MALTVADLIARLTFDASGAVAGATQASSAVDELEASTTAATSSMSVLAASAEAAQTVWMTMTIGAAQVTEAMSALSADVITTADLTATAYEEMGAAAQGMLAEIEAADEGGIAANEALESSFKALEAGSVGSLAGILGLAGAALIAVMGIDKMVNSAINWGEQVRKIELQTGATAQQASDLAVTFDHLGINIDLGVRAMAMFELRLQTGLGVVKDYWSASDLLSMKHEQMIQLLPQLQEKYASLGSETEKTTFLTNLFGVRIGYQMRDLLAMTTDQMKEMTQEAKNLGLELNQSQVDAAHNAKLSMNDFKDSLEALGVQLGQDFMPALLAAANAITGLAQLVGPVLGTAFKVIDPVINGIANSFKGLAGIITGHTSAIQADMDAIEQHKHGLSAWWQGVQDVIKGQNELDKSAGIMSADVSAAYQSLTGVVSASVAAQLAGLGLTAQEMQQVAKDAASLDHTIGQYMSLGNTVSMVSSDISSSNKTAKASTTDYAKQAESDLHSIEQAQLSLTAAQKAFNTLAAGPDPLTLASNMLQVQSSLKGVRDAQQAVTDAQAALDSALKGPSADTMAQAQEDVAKAKLNVQKANLQVSASEQNLQNVQNSGTSTMDQLQQAQIQLQESRFGVTDANTALTAAEQKLQDLMPGSLAQTTSVTAATNKLSDARLSLQQANLSQQQAQKALNDLVTASIPGSDAYTQALQRMTDAEYNLSQAQQRAADDAKKASDAQVAGAQAASGATSKAVADMSMSWDQFAAKQREQIANTNAFVTNLRELLKYGLDPTFVFNLAQQGVDKVGGLVSNIVQQVHSGNTKSINDLESTMDITNANFKQFMHDLQNSANYGVTIPLQIDYTGYLSNGTVSVNGVTTAVPNAPDMTTRIEDNLSTVRGVNGHHSGGLILHSGGLADDVPATLQRGEYVMRRSSVQSIGLQALSSMNATGRIPASAAAASNSGGAPDRPLVINLQVDGRTLAQVVRPSILEDLKMGRLQNSGF